METANSSNANALCKSSTGHTPLGWQWDADQLQAWQLESLNKQLRAILPANQFYAHKLGVNELQLKTLDELSTLPFTTKSELVESQREHGLSRHHTFDASAYTRVHRTSGTSGSPLLIMDTADDWQWWADAWQHVLCAGEVTAADRVFMAFSFGPFIGFWSAYEACVQLGARLIPGGGLSTLSRLDFMHQTQPTVIACTPSYALQMAEVARAHNISLAALPIRRLLVAGEPGGSIAATRDRIEHLWDARVVDHCGATEIGPWGFGWPTGGGVHVNEACFVAELLPLQETSGQRTGLSELVLTSLGRHGAPVIRYRTGDLVRTGSPPKPECRFLWLDGGVIGRSDDMVVVRGVNVFPSSIDAVLNRVPGIAEYRVLIRRRGELDDLKLEVECEDATSQRLATQLEIAIGLRIDIELVPVGSLPRSEGKARRWIDERHT